MREEHAFAVAGCQFGEIRREQLSCSTDQVESYHLVRKACSNLIAREATMVGKKQKTGIEWVGGLGLEIACAPTPEIDAGVTVMRAKTREYAETEQTYLSGSMGSRSPSPFDPQQGLIELPGEPVQWIWAFTCPHSACECRSAIVLSAPGGRDALVAVGRPVADAWVGDGKYGKVAQELQGSIAFEIDLDARRIYRPTDDEPLDLALHPSLREVVDRMDDDVFEAIARLWYLSKGETPPTVSKPGTKIAVTGWRAGDRLPWGEAWSSLMDDVYVFGERAVHAGELYCVESNCSCAKVLVDFDVIAPRGAPHLGHVEFDGNTAILRPDHERHRAELSELWDAFRARHPRYVERFAQRGAVMHGLAGRIVPEHRTTKVGRNEPCLCGSGKKYKKCCGAAT
jgi:hypothetical protein